MVLTKCKECGKEVSKKADKCPHCGAPLKPKQYGCGTLIGIVILGIIVIYLFNTNTSNNSGSRSTSTYSITSGQSSSRSYSPLLEVLSWRCEKEYGYVYVVGEVKNVSESKLKNVMAVGEFRSKDGILVKSEDALIDYNPLLPGQTSPFKAGGTDNPAITNCNLSFKYLFGGEIPYTIAESKMKKQKEKIAEAQRLLLQLGYKLGKADGIMGPNTKEAIKAFQRERNLTVDGKVTDQLLNRLRQAGK